MAPAAVMEDDFPRLELFNCKLFLAAHAAMLSSSAVRESAHSAGMTRYVSYANLPTRLLAWSGLRSAAVTGYDAGPRLEP